MARKTRKQKELENKAYLKQLEYLEMKGKGFIKDNYPDVESITFEMNYKDFDNMADLSPDKYEKRPENYAHFKFDCPCKECIDGGYDLDIIVDKIIKENKNNTGTIICKGWQDRERINKHRCWCELNYRIVVKYKE
jgi:hypothetical protein